jgi:thiol-disulfide isomerase/thioredoxin
MSTEVGQLGARHQGVASAHDLPVEDRMASFDGAITWFNSKPLTPEGLRGSVVLVQFWTYTCINWLRTLPYVRGWAQKYTDHGLVVIGVHTPEFEFEKKLDNLRRAAEDMRIRYPIAVDSDYAVWQAFANHYWPALYFADAQGRIRHHRFGEGDYERSEMVIRQLLAAAGKDALPQGLVEVDATGPEVAADWVDLGSQENYLGSDRTDNFEKTPTRLQLNHWSLSGDWKVAPGSIHLKQPGGRISYGFHARDLHLVMGPAAGVTSVRFRVLIDGQAPGSAHGVDVDAQGNGTVAEQRMYQLIRQAKPITDRQFEIEFLDSGVEAFVFTFG